MCISYCYSVVITYVLLQVMILIIIGDTLIELLTVDKLRVTQVDSDYIISLREHNYAIYWGLVLNEPSKLGQF